MNDPAERQELVEQVVGAHRERGPLGEVRSSPAFHDLDAAARIEAFERTREARQLERAADPEGLTSTARALMARLRRAAP